MSRLTERGEFVLSAAILIAALLFVLGCALWGDAR